MHSLRKKKRIWQWCISPEEKSDYSIGGCHADKTVPKYIRCPKCNRRLKPRLVNTEPEDMVPDYHAFIPPHKTTS